MPGLPLFLFFGPLTIVLWWIVRPGTGFWRNAIIGLAISAAATALYQLIVWLQLGYLDPLFLVASAVQLVGGLLLTAMVVVLKPLTQRDG